MRPLQKSFDNKMRQSQSILEDPKIQSFLDQYPNYRQTLTEEVDELLSAELGSHPFAEEAEILDNTCHLSLEGFGQEFGQILEYLASIYSTNHFNFSFFRQQKGILDAPQSIFSTRFKSTIRQEITLRWKYLLQQKIDQWQMEELDTNRKSLLEDLYSKIDRIQSLADVLGEDGALWDYAAGNWNPTRVAILSYYADLLAEEDQLLDLAQQLGRAALQHNSPSSSSRTSRNGSKGQLGREELVGIHESNDINYLTSSERSLLGEKTLQTLFYLKMAEYKLLSFDLQGSVSGEISESTSDVSVQERGPIIICLDTSASMAGSPEKIAKTFCLAVLKVALHEDRSCYLISFATTLKTMEITDLEYLEGVITFLDHYFQGGGTDPTAALAKAEDLITKSEYKNADLLLISDFVMDNLGEQATQSIEHLHNQGVSLHSLAISSSYNSEVLEWFTTNWSYRPGTNQPLQRMNHAGRSGDSIN